MPPKNENEGKTSNENTQKQVVVIKKYANRRLYNTASSSYVTLDHLSELVKENVEFVVYDAKTGEDITRSVLTQIIFDEESRGQNLLPIQFLRQLIRFYGDSMQSFLPGYLEMSLENFTRQQDRFRQQFSPLAPAAGLAAATTAYEEQIRQNMVLFNRAMSAFTPFGFAKPGDPPSPSQTEEPAAHGAADPDSSQRESLNEMRRQLEAMKAQIDRLSGN